MRNKICCKGIRKINYLYTKKETKMYQRNLDERISEMFKISEQDVKHMTTALENLKSGISKIKTNQSSG